MSANFESLFLLIVLEECFDIVSGLGKLLLAEVCQLLGFFEAKGEFVDAERIVFKTRNDGLKSVHRLRVGKFFLHAEK